MILALDISTSCVGFALFNSEGDRLEELSCIKFRNKLSLFEKLDELEKALSHIVENADITAIVIEEPLKKFMGKFSSATTIALLNNFNGMVSAYLFMKLRIQPMYYNVNTARKTVFPDFKASKSGGNSTKHEIWSRVKDMEPQINWRYGVRSAKLLDENYDMCDSYVIGVCHVITMRKQNN